MARRRKAVWAGNKPGERVWTVEPAPLFGDTEDRWALRMDGRLVSAGHCSEAVAREVCRFYELAELEMRSDD